MGLTTTNASAALKEDYQPAIREQLNNAIMLLQQIEKNSTDIEGKRAVLSLHVGRSSGVGARVEGGTLPTAGNQAYAEERVPVKYNYGRIQLSGPVIRAMKSDAGSFARAVASESKGITNDIKRDVNRQLWNDTSGKIVGCGVTSAAALVVLATTTPQSALRQLEVGQKVDIGTTANAQVVVAGATIVSVDFTVGAPKVTIDSSVTTTASHFLFRAGINGTGAAANIEMTGLQSIVATSGSLFNVDPATYTNWVSTVDSNSGTNRAISETLVAKNLHLVEIASGESPDLLVSSPGVHRAYANLLTALKRFSNTVDIAGGYTALDVSAGGGSKPLVWERDTPDNQMYLLNTGHLTEFQMSDWEFMEEDGSVLFRVSNSDAYEATLFKYAELATDQRNTHGLIKDITEA